MTATERQDRRAGHQHDRLPRRLRLGRDGGLAAADQRRGHPAGQPREPLRRADLLARRRPGRARTLLPERQTQRSCACSPATPSQAAAQVQLMRVAGRAQACTCSTTRTRSRCRSPQIVATTPNAPASRSPRTTASPRPPTPVFTGEVEKIVASGAQAVFLAGGDGAGTVALWRELHARRPAACCCSARARWSANRSPRRSARRGAQTLSDDAAAAACAAIRRSAQRRAARLPRHVRRRSPARRRCTATRR